jgi:S-adenosylmethionine decarboxylase
LAQQLGIGGRHVIADLFGAPVDRLRAMDDVMAGLEAALVEAGFHVLGVLCHRFPAGGEGFTGVVLLSQSHAALHTYPEAGYAAMDVFSCGQVQAEPVIEAVRRLIGARAVALRRLDRRPRETPPAGVPSPGPPRYTGASFPSTAPPESQP